MVNGFFKVPHKIMLHPLLTPKASFTNMEAYLWLRERAAFKAFLPT
jgi:hypothetical protein